MSTKSNTVVQNLGTVTAYKYAKTKGFTGTEEEFAEMMSGLKEYYEDTIDAKAEVAENLTKVQGYATTVEGHATEVSTDRAAVVAATGEVETNANIAKGAIADTKATEATTAAGNAATSEQNAADSEDAAADSARIAGNAQTAAEGFANAAAASATQASGYADAALTSAGNSAASALDASGSASAAATSETNAGASAASASGSATAAAASASDAEESADLAQSYAVGTEGEVRQDDDEDNAKYYKEQTEISASAADASARSAAGSAETASQLVQTAAASVGEARQIIEDGEEIIQTLTDIDAALASKLDVEEKDPTVQGSLAYQIENIQVAPFEFAISDQGVYGYIKEGETEVTPFRNPAGTATAADVLSGKTFANASSDSLEGEMPLRANGGNALKVGKDTNGVYAYFAEGFYARHVGDGASGGYIYLPASMIGSAAASEVLSGKTFTSSEGALVEGTMVNQGKKTQTLNAGASYTIPEGYHNGQGKVTANTLAAQTTVDSDKTAAAAGQIPTGYQAWVNGAKVTGSMANRGAVTQTINAGASYTIPAGYHNGQGKVTGHTLASQTGVDDGKTAAAAAQILTGYQAWVNGSKITGNMANQGKKTATLNTGTTSYTIPAGYHNGEGKVSITTQTKTQAAGTTAVTVAPDSGKVLSSVTVSAVSATKTLDATNGTKVDMGGAYRYVNTNAVYNAGLAAGKSAAAITVTTATCTLTSTDGNKNFTGTLNVGTGYTLWKDLFVRWDGFSEDQDGKPEDFNLTYTYSGSTLTCKLTRTSNSGHQASSSITCTVYKLKVG